jgi:Fe2+ or Zn2+ uptake regulation protein
MAAKHDQDNITNNRGLKVLEVISFISCDHCGQRREVSNHLPSKKMINDIAKSAGFLVVSSKQLHFCDVKCKGMFNTDDKPGGAV